MEELLIALVVWLGKVGVRFGKWVREKVRGTRPEGGADAAQGPIHQYDAGSPSRAAAGSMSQRKQALGDRLGELEREALDRARTLGRMPANLPLSQALDPGVVARCRALKDELGRVVFDADAPVAADRISARVAALSTLVETLHWMAEQREASPGAKGLYLADEVAKECYGPILNWSRYQSGVSIPEVTPLSLIGEGRALAPEGLIDVGVTPIVLPETFPDTLDSWPLIAHEVGRGVLQSVQGLQWEIRDRYTLPERYPVPFAFRGYLGEDEVVRPFGVWLDRLFGDILGAALLGPAYGLALCAHLSRRGEPSAISAVAVDASGTAYAKEPPFQLRMAAVVSVLDVMGFAPQGARVWQRWNELHEWPRRIHLPTRIEGWVEADLRPFEDLAARLSAALVTQPFSALADRSVDRIPGLMFSEARQAEAQALAETISDLQSSGAPSGRVAISAALLAADRSPARARQILGWLQGRLTPTDSASPAAVRPSRREHGEGRHEGTQASLFRDAIIFGELLTRRRSFPPGRAFRR